MLHTGKVARRRTLYVSKETNTICEIAETREKWTKWEKERPLVLSRNSDALLNSEENPRPEDEKKNHSQDSIFAGSSRPLSLWKRSRYKYVKKYSLSWLYHKRFSHFNHICKRKRQPNSVELFSEHIHLLSLNYYIHFKLF